MTPKDRYRVLCSEEPGIPIFSRAWWLDAVCGDAWDVCLVEKSGHVLAAMPYYRERKLFCFRVLKQPPLTQTLGPWIRPLKGKYAKRLGREKDLLNSLIDQLPVFDHFSQSWHPAQTNWLPFYWRGFRQTTFYSYKLPSLTDLDLVWSGFRENIRSDIRKAANRHHLRVRQADGPEPLLKLVRSTFRRQNGSPPYPDSLVARIHEACRKRNAGRSFIAVDNREQIHAGAYIVWDEHCAYYLLGGGDPALRSSGAASLCLWEAIQFSAGVTRSFDFEGSMIESVERYFRAFGAIQTPYFHLSLTPSLPLKVVLNFK